MITDAQTNLIIDINTGYGIEKKEVRSYEVSLWTLQDSFITVLKWSDAEQKGRIENPKMILDIDGTQELTFSIPMYYHQDGILEPNPNWYTTRNGNLIAGLRKIKVIFNKEEPENKKVLEFVILDVEEVHENDVLTCNVKCEGLAFHELGKIGYKLSLSYDEYYERYKKWAETGIDPEPPDPEHPEIEPMADLAYWCKKTELEEYKENMETVNPNVWYYKIQMNWNSFENGSSQRAKNQVYEETYTTSWDNELKPVKTESFTIKQRMVDAKNSNKYNITQTIAETFGVFCAYEYEHDENNQIISRTVVFYNNFFKEEEGYLSLTYPYDTNKVSRRMDSTDLTTKLYVLKVDDDTTLQGFHSIMDSEANKTKEDYILNFDYLHEIGTITDEQYEEIDVYEKAVRQLNDELIPLQQRKAAIEADIVDLEARKTILENAIQLDQEQVDANNALKTALIAQYGNATNSRLQVSSNNPATSIVIPDSSTKGHAILRGNLGIVFDTLSIFSNSDCAVEHRISGFTAQYDDNGNLERINNLPYHSTESNIVYMIYEYDPSSYYDAILNTWEQRLNKDSAEKTDLEELLGEDSVVPENKTGLHKSLYNIETDINNTLEKKKELISKFEQMMGPALREGYWQPDNYSDYGEIKKELITLDLKANKDITADTGTDAQFIWDFGKENSTDEDDSRLFYNEQKLYYISGAASQDKVYYPLINVAGLYGTVDLTQYSFYFDTNYEANDFNNYGLKYRQFFAIGSQAKLIFIKRKNTDTVIPALILLGAKNLTSDQLTRMYLTGYIGKINYTDMSFDISEEHHKVMTSNKISWIKKPNAYEVPEDVYETTYPRIKISSMNLKTQSNDIIIHYNSELLSMFKDYYVNIRETKRNDSYYAEYFITLKPEVIFRHGTCNKQLNINYIISTANTSIYLDALEISHENAYPKVSYELEAHLIDTKYYENELDQMNIDYTNYWVSHTLYNRLAQLLMINDTDLKFKDTFGYISRLNLDLDAPWKDTIEVRNYKTKFEDLFSTIVASTEEMKRISQGISGLLSGQTGLSNAGFTDTLAQNSTILNNYLDSYFNTSPSVEERLTSIFNEAGSILADASKSLDNIRTLNTENASILAGFVQDIGSEVAAQTFRQQEEPHTFKTGDRWIQIDENKNVIAEYTAVCNSDQTTSNGWRKTFDGALAQIKGATLNIDSAKGIIDVEAENQINIKSGNNIYIAADERVDIVGNREVNISGTAINLLSGRNSETNQEQISGINLISSGSNNVQFEDEDGNHINPQAQINDLIGDSGISKVLINPTKIEMASSNIVMRGKNKIQMVTSKNSLQSTSALSLDPYNGIWIGSGKGIRLYSGNINLTQNTDGTFSLASGIGASVELLPTRLLFGVSNTSGNATAVEMTDSYFILGAGDQMDNLRDYNFTNGNLIGVKATKDYIGLATGAGINRSLVYISPAEILLGNSSNQTSGAFVSIKKSGIIIGGDSTLQVNMTNFQLDASGNVIVKGNITAINGSIGGWFIGSDYIGTAATRDTSNVGLCSVSDIRFWAGGIRNQNPPFYVLNDGTLKSTKAIISGNITATTLSVGSGNNLLTYDSTHGLIVKGNITANSGSIGGWALDTTNTFSSLTNAESGLDKVYIGKKTVNTIDWIIYAGADEPEFTGTGGPQGWGTAAQGSRRPGYWAPFRLNTKGELYTEVLCIGNGPANVPGNTNVGSGWDDYVGKIWLFVKVSDDDFEWKCIDSTALYNAVTSPATYIYVQPNTKPSGGASSGGCFIAGTQVLLASGDTIAIEKLQLGMKIVAYNEDKEQFDEAEITFVQMLKHKTDLYDVQLSTGKVITLTASHPLLTTNGWRSLDIPMTEYEYHIQVSKLKIGDKLITPLKEDIYVKDIRYREDLIDTTVYHCRVDPYHTFVVEDIVAHNMKAQSN